MVVFSTSRSTDQGVASSSVVEAIDAMTQIKTWIIYDFMR